jgi:peptide chain release factor 3
LTSDHPEKLKEFCRLKSQEIVLDKDGNEVFLAPSQWILNLEKQNNPDIAFHFTSEFKTATELA